MDKKCADCGVMFNPNQQGVVGTINGKTIAYCSDCCRKDN